MLIGPIKYCRGLLRLYKKEENNMVNLYKCEKCGTEYEIPDGHPNNKNVNVRGYYYITNCSMCEYKCEEI